MAVKHTFLFCCFLMCMPSCLSGKKSSDSGGSNKTSAVAVEGFIKPGPNTVVLTERQKKALLNVDEAGNLTFSKDISEGTLQLKASSPFSIGQVLVIADHPKAPNGLLRKVKSVAPNGSGFLVSTEQATLADAIESANVKIQLPLDPTGAKETLPAINGVSRQDPAFLNLAEEKEGLYFGINDLVLRDLDGDHKTTNDQLILNGNLGVDAGVVITLKVTGFDVKELSLAIEGSQSGLLSLSGSLSTSFKEKLNISLLHYSPIVITVGSFPLVLTPSMGIAVGAEGEASGAFKMSASEEAKVKVGVGYADGSVGPIAEGSIDGKAEGPQIDASVGAKAFGAIRGELKIYGIAGGFAGMEGFAKFKASLLESTCYLASAGLGAQAGLYAGIFGLKIADYQQSWDILSKDIGTGNCSGSGATGADPQTYSWLYGEPSTDDNLSFPVFANTAGGGLSAARSRNVNGYTMKLNGNGEVAYFRDAQDTSIESYRAIRELKDGGQILAGSGVAPVVIRLNSTGEVKWAYQYNIPGVYTINTVDESKTDGSIIVGGNIYTSDDVNEDAFLIKLDADGNALWSKRLKGPNNSDQIYVAKFLADDRIVTGGSYGITSSTSGIHDDDKTKASLGWLAILDSSGNIQLSKLYTSMAIIDLIPINGASDGFLTVGFTEKSVDGSLVRVPWIMSIRADGAIGWKQGMLEHVLPMSIALADDGGAIVTGIRGFTFGDRVNHDGWMARLTSSGNVSWARRYGSEKEDGLLFVHQRKDGRIIAGGYQVPDEDTLKPWYLSLPSNGEATFKESSSFTASNTSASLFTPPLSFIDASITPSSLNPAKEDWSRTLTNASVTSEMIAGP